MDDVCFVTIGFKSGAQLNITITRDELMRLTEDVGRRVAGVYEIFDLSDSKRINKRQLTISVLDVLYIA